MVRNRGPTLQPRLSARGRFGRFPTQTRNASPTVYSTRRNREIRYKTRVFRLPTGDSNRGKPHGNSGSQEHPGPGKTQIQAPQIASCYEIRNGRAIKVGGAGAALGWRGGLRSASRAPKIISVQPPRELCRSKLHFLNWQFVIGSLSLGSLSQHSKRWTTHTHSEASGAAFRVIKYEDPIWPIFNAERP
jgi:hypothetical protein